MHRSHALQIGQKRGSRPVGDVTDVWDEAGRLVSWSRGPTAHKLHGRLSHEPDSIITESTETAEEED